MHYVRGRPRKYRTLLGAILLVAIACSDDEGKGPPPAPSNGPFTDPAFPEVWTINASDGQSYEFKSNCVGEFEELETCFLWTVTAVIVVAPDGDRFELDKDFNINAYSGEVTRRWVLYGPTGGGLPAAGIYQFLYYRGEELALAQNVSYIPETIGHRTDVTWRRDDSDLFVEWTPPDGATPEMWYKVLIFPDGGDVISNIFDFDSSSALLPDIPLADGATGTLNVAIYFMGGFSPSEYLPLTW